MSEEQQSQVIATSQLTEEQVRLAVAEFLFKSEELREAVQDLQIRVVTNWQTTKWSDPNAMVHITIQHAPEGDPVGEDSQTESGDSSEFSSGGDDSGTGSQLDESDNSREAE